MVGNREKPGGSKKRKRSTGVLAMLAPIRGVQKEGLSQRLSRLGEKELFRKERASFPISKKEELDQERKVRRSALEIWSPPAEV